MGPRTLGELLVKRSRAPRDEQRAPDPGVVLPWWMDPAGLRGKFAPGDRRATGRITERVPPDP